MATLEDASRLHGDRLDAIETTLVAMEEKPQSVNITVQGDMIGNSIGLGAVAKTDAGIGGGTCWRGVVEHVVLAQLGRFLG